MRRAHLTTLDLSGMSIAPAVYYTISAKKNQIAVSSAIIEYAVAIETCLMTFCESKLNVEHPYQKQLSFHSICTRPRKTGFTMNSHHIYLDRL